MSDRKHGIFDVRRQSKMYPELERYETSDAAKAAWRAAWWRVLRTLRFWAIGIVLIGVAPASISLFIVYARRLLSIPIPPVLWGGLIGGVIGGFMGLGFQLAFRTPVRRSLREDLVCKGVPICVNCGYDLRGLEEPRCPECGEAFDPALTAIARPGISDRDDPR